MLRLRTWQWIILVLPIALVGIFLLVAAGFQIHEWRLNWLWGVFTLLFVAWRFLLVKWTRPVVSEIETAIAAANRELETSMASTPAKNVEEALQTILLAARDDRPIWEDWGTFWKRCQEIITAVAHNYYPDVKYPLLNIYIPQAYGLIRGTVDETDRWMRNLSPTLNQITVGQAYQAYEVYQKLEPSARKLWQVWNWAQWILNPAAAAARTASQRYSDRADRQLLINLGQILRETALRNLCRQAVLLYSGEIPAGTPAAIAPKTTTLQEILVAAEPVEEVERKPVSLLIVGRTGAGKSSLINTLFRSDRARVDILPSTDEIQAYHWRAEDGEELTLFDTPGYEQSDRPEYRLQVLEHARAADAVLLVTPALDPALQMDVDFLRDLQENVEDLPVFVCVSQVDRLRPIREWHPPYDWLNGDRPKEKNIRECIEYRAELFADSCDRIFPVVTEDGDRVSWGTDILSLALVDAIQPAKQSRLSRFLRDLNTRAIATAKIIDRYTFQMTTTQGITAFLKSPILTFLSTLATGSPALARVLAAQIPVEQLPVVIGKLQMAYELFNLLSPEGKKFDLISLWPLLLETPAAPDRDAWAFGHALVEYWTRDLSIEGLEERYRGYLERKESVGGHK